MLRVVGLKTDALAVTLGDDTGDHELEAAMLVLRVDGDHAESSDFVLGYFALRHLKDALEDVLDVWHSEPLQSFSYLVLAFTHQSVVADVT